jgi:hypothetical protein
MLPITADQRRKSASPSLVESRPVTANSLKAIGDIVACRSFVGQLEMHEVSWESYQTARSGQSQDVGTPPSVITRTQT